jgi:hypothetical protein
MILFNTKFKKLEKLSSFLLLPIDYGYKINLNIPFFKKLQGFFLYFYQEYPIFL